MGSRRQRQKGLRFERRDRTTAAAPKADDGIRRAALVEADRRRRRRLGLTVGATVVAVVAVASSLLASGVLDRAAAVADLLGPRPPYVMIVYQVSTAASGANKPTWEVLTAARPFQVSDLDYDAPPLSGARPTSGTVSTFDGLYDLQGGHLYLVSDRQPGPGSGDQALGPELGDLVARHLAQPLHQTKLVAGRRCTVFRFSGPPAGPITPLSGANHDDLCIDNVGLLLSEQWTYNGHVVLQRTATTVSLTASGPRPVGAPPVSTALVAPSSTDLLEATTTGSHASFLGSPPAPAGFTPQPVLSTIAFDPTQPGQVDDSSTLWSFVRGGDSITVEAGQGALPWQSGDTTTAPLRLAGLGAASSALRSDGPEIRVELGQDQWVRVHGTVPLTELVAYASELRMGGS